MKQALTIAIAGIAAVALYNYLTQYPADTGSSAIIDLGANLNNFIGNVSMKTSAIGRDAIKQREGTRFVVYPDSAGILTAGIGHALRRIDGSFAVGDTVTLAQVSGWFDADIAHAENIVNSYVNIPLTQNQFDALVSMAFNMGSAVFRNADGTNTGIMAALNAGDYAGAAAQFPAWNHAGGVVVVGLTNRRLSEQQQFMA